MPQWGGHVTHFKKDQVRMIFCQIEAQAQGRQTHAGFFCCFFHKFHQEEFSTIWELNAGSYQTSWMAELWWRWRSLWQGLIHSCCCTTVPCTLSCCLRPPPKGPSRHRPETRRLREPHKHPVSRSNLQSLTKTPPDLPQQSGRPTKKKTKTTHRRSRWCGHSGRSWRGWWAPPYRWGRPARSLRPSWLPPASGSPAWGSCRRPWRAAASPPWRMSSRTAGTGRSCHMQNRKKHWQLTYCRSNLPAAIKLCSCTQE